MRNIGKRVGLYNSDIAIGKNKQTYMKSTTFTCLMRYNEYNEVATHISIGDIVPLKSANCSCRKINFKYVSS